MSKDGLRSLTDVLSAHPCPSLLRPRSLVKFTATVFVLLSIEARRATNACTARLYTQQCVHLYLSKIATPQRTKANMPTTGDRHIYSPILTPVFDRKTCTCIIQNPVHSKIHIQAASCVLLLCPGHKERPLEAKDFLCQVQTNVLFLDKKLRPFRQVVSGK